jgi:putative ABC transport system ATP-binding protein
VPAEYSQNSCIVAQNLCKSYKRGVEEVHALQEVSFTIHRGELVSVVGQSGSGKTTLLNLIGCMDVPTSGRLLFESEDIGQFSERARTQLRREHIGFIFQHFGLIPTLSVRENIALPALFARRHVHRRVDELLEKVALTHRRDHRPHELSGGEMQRVAIARALINSPRVLLADEPTGNLDSVTGESVIQAFIELVREGLTIVVVTHNPDLAAVTQRQLMLHDGKLQSEQNAHDRGNI